MSIKSWFLETVADWLLVAGIVACLVVLVWATGCSARITPVQGSGSGSVEIRDLPASQPVVQASGPQTGGVNVGNANVPLAVTSDVSGWTGISVTNAIPFGLLFILSLYWFKELCNDYWSHSREARYAEEQAKQNAVQAPAQAQANDDGVEGRAPGIGFRDGP